jgi:hypothetical protein
MPRFLRTTLGAAVIATTLVLGAIASFFLLHPVCDEDVLAERSSPDNQFKAVLIRRNCGATASFMDHISLSPAPARLRRHLLTGVIDQGDVFRLERSHEGKVNFMWASPRKLRVEYPGSEQVFLKSSTWNVVDIEYGQMKTSANGGPDAAPF